MNQNYADVSTQGNIQTSAGDMVVHEAQKSSADAITEAIALPLAELLGNFAVEAVTGKLYPQTQELKANLRARNLAEHMSKVQEFSDVQQVKQHPPTLEAVKLTEEWIGHVQDIDPDDQPFAEFWQKWLAELTSTPHDAAYRQLLHSLEEMDGLDAKLLIKVGQNDEYTPQNLMEKNHLVKLEKLLLIQDANINDRIQEQQKRIVRFDRGFLDFMVAFLLSIFLTLILTLIFRVIESPYITTISDISVTSKVSTFMKELYPDFLDGMYQFIFLWGLCGVLLVPWMLIRYLSRRYLVSEVKKVINDLRKGKYKLTALGRKLFSYHTPSFGEEMHSAS